MKSLTWKGIYRLRTQWGVRILARRSDGKLVLVSLNSYSKYLRDGRATLATVWLDETQKSDFEAIPDGQ